MDPRFLRQVILPEIGLAGQKRLAGVLVDPGNDSAATAARRYLQGAGLQLVETDAPAHRSPRPVDAHGATPDDASTSPDGTPVATTAKFPHAGYFRHSAAAEVAEGAWRALHVIRRTLLAPELSPDTSPPSRH